MQEFKGIKQVLKSTFDSTEPADKVGYLWFVRANTEATEGQIYLGSRLYGAGSVEVINNLSTKVDNITNAVGGLDENGEYVGSAPVYTIIADAESVQQAIEKLDEYARGLNASRVTGMTYENGVLTLVAQDQSTIATVNLPLEQFLKSAELVVDPEGMAPGKYLKLVFAVEGQADNTVYVAVNDLVDVYTAGGGISIANNVISINEEALTMIQYSDSEVRRLETAKVSWAYDTATQTNINILIPKGGSLLGNYGDDNAVLVKAGVYGEGDSLVKQTEVGSAKIHLNLNSSDRPTVELSGGTKEQVAYVSDLEAGLTLETATEETVAAGHIELQKGENGLFGVMYYDGDDVEA